MKQQEDQGLSERQFAEGDHVFLRLQPYKKTSLKDDHFHKMACRSQACGTSGLSITFS